MTDDAFDDATFLRRLREGDGDAFRQVIRHFHPVLVGAASHVLGSRALAEEVVQETWLAVLSAIGRFEGRCALGSWLHTITLNRARTTVRRERRMVRLAGPGDRGGPDEPRQPLNGNPALHDDLDPERIYSGRELWRVAATVIAQMPAGQRAAIGRLGFDDAGDNAGELMRGISPGNHRVMLHRARVRVRVALDQVTAGPRTGGAAVARRVVPRAAGGGAGLSAALG